MTYVTALPPPQAEVAETAEALSGAARPLSELASLLPAGPLVSSSAAASEARRRAASSAAARDGWLWSQQGGSGSSGDDGAMAGGGGVAAAAEREEAKEEDWGADGGGDGMLGIDLESLSSAAVALWSSLVPAAGGGGGGGGGAAGRRPATMLQALNEALRRCGAHCALKLRSVIRRVPLQDPILPRHKLTFPAQDLCAPCLRRCLPHVAPPTRAELLLPCLRTAVTARQPPVAGCRRGRQGCLRWRKRQHSNHSGIIAAATGAGTGTGTGTRACRRLGGIPTAAWGGMCPARCAGGP